MYTQIFSRNNLDIPVATEDDNAPTAVCMYMECSKVDHCDTIWTDYTYFQTYLTSMGDRQFALFLLSAETQTCTVADSY